MSTGFKIFNSIMKALNFGQRVHQHNQRSYDNSVKLQMQRERLEMQKERHQVFMDKNRKDDNS